MSNLEEGDFVFKEYIWDSNYELEDYEFMRMDAITAERLYWSPRIVDIYAFCGLGMINEAMVHGDMEHIAVPSGEGRSEEFEDPETSQKLKVYNQLTGTKKLEFALDMAEAVLLMHSFPDGVIVHDGTYPTKVFEGKQAQFFHTQLTSLCFLPCLTDIQLSQFLLSNEGTLVLNDFNRAEIMLFNEKDQEYCRYRNNPGHGDVSPCNAVAPAETCSLAFAIQILTDNAFLVIVVASPRGVLRQAPERTDRHLVVRKQFLCAPDRSLPILQRRSKAGSKINQERQDRIC